MEIVIILILVLVLISNGVLFYLFLKKGDNQPNSSELEIQRLKDENKQTSALNALIEQNSRDRESIIKTIYEMNQEQSTKVLHFENKVAEAINNKFKGLEKNVQDSLFNGFKNSNDTLFNFSEKVSTLLEQQKNFGKTSESLNSQISNLSNILK